MVNSSDVILMGKVVAPSGVIGEFKVCLFVETLVVDSTLKEFFLETPGISGVRKMELIRVKPFNKWVRFYVKGINNREAACSLVGSNLYVSKLMLPPLEEDTHFCSDLIGVSVVLVSGEVLGCLDSIIFTGANDVYVVKRRGIAGDVELLIPAIKSVVLNVDLDNNIMLVDIPDGLR